MVKQENPILELVGQNKLDIARVEEDRKRIFILVDEAIQSQNYERAEQILRDNLYKNEFNDYQRSLKTYRELKELVDTSTILKKDKVFLDYFEGILEQRELLHNFNQRISPLILRIRKLAGEETE